LDFASTHSTPTGLGTLLGFSVVVRALATSGTWPDFCK